MNDYKAAEDAVKNGHIDNCDPNYDHLDTIQTALRIAHRLQSGEVKEIVESIEFQYSGEGYDYRPKWIVSDDCRVDIMKFIYLLYGGETTAQMTKEIDDAS